MRHFAITGIVTASWISRIMPGSDMRATPPSRRMSAGTRSSAMTAHAPGVLGDHGLLGVDDVHDDAALEHLGEAALDAHGAGFSHAAVLGHGRSVARRLPPAAGAGTSRRSGGLRDGVAGGSSCRRPAAGASGAAGAGRCGGGAGAGAAGAPEPKPPAPARPAASEPLSVAALAAAAALPAAAFIERAHLA